jgi:hypothetical protein
MDEGIPSIERARHGHTLSGVAGEMEGSRTLACRIPGPKYGAGPAGEFHIGQYRSCGWIPESPRICRIRHPETIHNQTIRGCQTFSVWDRYNQNKNAIQVSFIGVDSTPILMGKGCANKSICSLGTQDKIPFHHLGGTSFLQARYMQVQPN